MKPNFVVEDDLGRWLPVIGLEVHVQLKTKSKMFCSCAVNPRSEPNKNICPVCTGQPGVLPVINKYAVELAIKTALALNCKISPISIFARKNYYYPDLPKNYQISQYETPFATQGYVEIELQNYTKKIFITRIHLEEDAGKLLHAIGKEELSYSLIDYNRSGTPLLEIVTEPCIFSVEEANEYLVSLRNILRYIDVSDCDMEQGSFRCDANISVISLEEEFLSKFFEDKNFPTDFTSWLNLKPYLLKGTKTELKNMNSFKSIREALSYEIQRQVKLLSSKEKVVQQTRLWNEKLSITEPMRSKEEAHDYRYFPEPDLLPLTISSEWIQKVQIELPELPHHKKQRFKNIYGLSDYDATVLVSEKGLATFFDQCMSKTTFKSQDELQQLAKVVCNIITTELLGKLNAENKTISEISLPAEYITELAQMVINGTLSSKLMKEVFAELWVTKESPKNIVEKKGLVQITDVSELKKVVEEVIRENPQIVQDYKSGKHQAISALIGQAMKKTKGKANPKQLTELFKTILE